MEPNNHNKKVSITEEDVCNLLQRYTAATVLTLLKETAQIVDVKLDWNELVKKTDTGIKTAREYQMLWRHLAYRQPLVENLTAQDQPLDEDSDLEYELEACPPASDADAMEASNCVKILTSGSTNKSRMPNSSVFEVPKVSLGNPHVPKQSQAAGTSGEGLDASGLTSNNQKKRKLCTEEDPDRIAPVRKGEIKGEKNSTQRAQRANVIRKKQGTGGANTPLSEAQLATRYALDMALKVGPTTGGTVGNGHAGPHNAAKVSASKRNLPVTKVTAQSSQLLPSSVTGAASSGKPAPIASSSKLCPQKKAPPQSSVSAESIQAAAVAAGARIASPSDAACLLKAAQSKNAVHIRGGGPLVKTSAGNSSPLPPNVHLICTGKTTPSSSVAAGTASIAVGSQQAKGSAVVSTVLPVSQLPKAKGTSSVAMERISAPQQVENRISSATNVQGSDATPMTKIQDDSASVAQCLPKAALVKSQAPSLGADVGLTKETDVNNSRAAVNKDVAENEGKSDPCKQVLENPLPKNDNEQPHAVQRSCIPCENGTQGVSPTVIVDGGTEKIEVSSEGLAGAKNA